MNIQDEARLRLIASSAQGDAAVCLDTRDLDVYSFPDSCEYALECSRQKGLEDIKTLVSRCIIVDIYIMIE